MPRGPHLATAHPDGVALGDPNAGPIVLDRGGITADGGPTVPWSEVRALDLRCPSAGPGARAWSWTWQLLVSTILNHIPEPAQLELVVTTPSEQHTLTATCHTRAGYHADQITQLRTLLQQMTDNPSRRQVLDALATLVSELRAARGT